MFHHCLGLSSTHPFRSILRMESNSRPFVELVVSLSVYKAHHVQCPHTANVQLVCVTREAAGWMLSSVETQGENPWSLFPPVGKGPPQWTGEPTARTAWTASGDAHAQNRAKPSRAHSRIRSPSRARSQRNRYRFGTCWTSTALDVV